MTDDESNSYSSLSSILNGAGFFAVGQATSNILGFGVNLLLTHGLGPSLYGMYALAQTISRMVGSISNLGSDKAVLRYVSSNDYDREAYLGVSFATAFVGSIVASSLLFVAAPRISAHTFGDPRFVSSCVPLPSR